eukprot:3715346-Prymnesium_polylepis.4
MGPSRPGAPFWLSPLPPPATGDMGGDMGGMGGGGEAAIWGLAVMPAMVTPVMPPAVSASVSAVGLSRMP